jgi:hypothetical protein
MRLKRSIRYETNQVNFGRTAEETPLTREEFQLIRDSGAPGMAVVVAEYELDENRLNIPGQTPSANP